MREVYVAGEVERVYQVQMRFLVVFYFSRIRVRRLDFYSVKRVEDLSFGGLFLGGYLECFYFDRIFVGEEIQFRNDWFMDSVFVLCFGMQSFSFGTELFV